MKHTLQDPTPRLRTLGLMGMLAPAPGYEPLGLKDKGQLQYQKVTGFIPFKRVEHQGANPSHKMLQKSIEGPKPQACVFMSRFAAKLQGSNQKRFETAGFEGSVCRKIFSAQGSKADF